MIEFDNNGNVKNKKKNTILIKNIPKECSHIQFVKYVENAISCFYSKIYLIGEKISQSGIVIVNDYSVIKSLFHSFHNKKLFDYQSIECNVFYSKYQNGEFEYLFENLIQYS